MTVNVAPNSEAHLAADRDGVIRRSATYEVHLSGATLQAIAGAKHPEGIPGAIWQAIEEYLNPAHRMCPVKGRCMTDSDIEARAYAITERRQAYHRSER